MQQDQQKTPQQAQGNNLPGNEIIAGAYNEDQLDKLENNVKVDEQKAEEARQDASSEEGLNANAAGGEQQQRSDNSAGEELGGITNLSLDQLKKEGDNND